MKVILKRTYVSVLVYLCIMHWVYYFIIINIKIKYIFYDYNIEDMADKINNNKSRNRLIQTINIKIKYIKQDSRFNQTKTSE